MFEKPDVWNSCTNATVRLFSIVCTSHFLFSGSSNLTADEGVTFVIETVLKINSTSVSLILNSTAYQVTVHPPTIWPTSKLWIVDNRHWSILDPSHILVLIIGNADIITNTITVPSRYVIDRWFHQSVCNCPTSRRAQGLVRYPRSLFTTLEGGD